MCPSGLILNSLNISPFQPTDEIVTEKEIGIYRIHARKDKYEGQLGQKGRL
jgi:hypothetical protein